MTQQLTLTRREQADAAAGKLRVWRKMKTQPEPMDGLTWSELSDCSGWWESGDLLARCPLRVGSPVQLVGQWNNRKSFLYRKRKLYGTPILVSAVPEFRKGEGWGWLYTFDFSQGGRRI